MLTAAQVSEAAESISLDFLKERLRDVVSPYYCATEEKWIAEIVVRAKFEDKLVGKPLVTLRSQIRDALTAFFQNYDPAQIGLDTMALSELRAILARTFEATREKLAAEWCHEMRERMGERKRT